METSPMIIGEKYILRPAEEKDIPSIISCIREEYGDCYYRRAFYSEEYLRKTMPQLNLFVAMDGDNLCGFQSMISHMPEDEYVEGASQIFFKEYRGFGLSRKLVDYTYDLARKQNFYSIYATAVTFHKITQSMCEKEGMIPIGFNFGSYITSKMHNSFHLGTNKKYVQAILLLPLIKPENKSVYIAENTKELAEYIYSKLGIEYKILTDKSEPEIKQSDIETKVNAREQLVHIRVHTIGQDFKDKIVEIKDKYSGELWTIQLILPIEGPESVWAQEMLKNEGFFVSGMRPLCNKKEQIFMQYIGDVSFDVNQLELTDNANILIHKILSLKEED